MKHKVHSSFKKRIAAGALALLMALSQGGYAPVGDRVDSKITDEAEEERMDLLSASEEDSTEGTEPQTETPAGEEGAPAEDEGEPTVTPGEKEETPTGVPSENSGTPTVTPAEGAEVPTMTPAGEETVPTVMPGEEERPTVTPGEEEKPTVTPGEGERPTVTPGEGAAPTVTPGEGIAPTVMPGEGATPTETPGEEESPTVTPGGEAVPTVTPGEGTETPTVTPTGGATTPSVTPGEDEDNPMGDEGEAPTATPTEKPETPEVSPTETPSEGYRSAATEELALGESRLAFTVTAEEDNAPAEKWEKGTELHYTLVIENKGKELLGEKSDSNVKIKFQDSSDTILKPEVDDKEISVAGTGYNVTKDGAGVKITSANTSAPYVVMPAGAKVIVKFKVKITEKAANDRSFVMALNFQPSNLSISKQEDRTVSYTQNAGDLSSTGGDGAGGQDDHPGEGDNSGEGDSSGDGDNPGQDNDPGKGDDPEKDPDVPAAKYTLVYHLNAPDGTAENSQEGTDICTVIQNDSASFLLVPMGKDGTSTIFPYNSQKDNLKKGYYSYNSGYYFAGWSYEKKNADVNYASVDFPVSDFTGEDNRGFVTGYGNYSVTVDEGTKKDLYAVWTTKPGLFGYVLSGGGGNFQSESTTGGQKIFRYGNTISNAPKYVVYDNGYKKEDSGFSVTTEIPKSSIVTSEGPTFLAWFNKKPFGSEKYVVRGGDPVTYGGENNIYSLDAVWGTLSKGVDQTVEYDGQPHAIQFVGSRDSSPEDPDVIYTGGSYNNDAEDAFNGSFSRGNVTYTYSVKQDGATVKLKPDGTPADGDSEGMATVNEMPKFTEPGTYEYTVTATLKVPGGYTSNNTAITGIEVGTTTATLIITQSKGRLTYHSNIPGQTDVTWEDSNPTQSNGGYTYGVKQLGEAFKEKDFSGLTINLTDGHVKVVDTMYYFAGWAKSKDAASYGSIDYRVSVYEKNGSKSVRLIADGQTLTTSEKEAHLYAIWTTRPALLGYTMTIQDVSFSPGYGIEKLGNNGTTSKGAAKYVVLNGGYNYDLDKDKPITVAAAPTDNQNRYKFVAWYNKKYNAGAGKDGYNKNNDGDPFVFPGGTVYFGNTNTVFSLDAVWARVTAVDKRVPYDGTGHCLNNAAIEWEGGNIDAFQTGLNGTYTVIVTKDGNPLASKTGALADFNSLSLSSIEGLNFTDVGKYDYDIQIAITDGSGSGTPTGSQTVIKTNATLIIDPVLELSVQKTLEGRDWQAEESFAFTLSGESQGVSMDRTSTSVTAKNHTANFGRIQFSESGTYSFTVAEENSGKAGMTYADPQTVQVTVDYKANEPASISGDGDWDSSTDNNVYKKTLSFTNYYGAGSLTVKKELLEGGNKEREFHLNVSLPNNQNFKGEYDGITFVNGNASFSLKGGESITITGLPVGVEYLVTERWETDYETKYDK